MLIITRKLGERIMVGDDIVITLLEIKGSQARIGIEAPKDVTIHRQEIFDKIRQENLNASNVFGEDLDRAAAILGQITSR